MGTIPDLMFVIDSNAEEIAVKEARRMGVPVVAIVDTNVDPDLINYPVPANDDAFKSIALITRSLTDALTEGQALYKASPHLHEAAPETVQRDQDHRESRPREGRPGGDHEQRRRRVRRPEEHRSEPHTGEEKPQPPEAPPVVEPKSGEASAN
jgi:small subunit ribosomal protein S2